MKHSARFSKALLGLALIATVMSAGPAFAAERDRKGLFLGFNVGSGCTSFGTELVDQTLSDDGFHGGAGALRFGYAFNNKLAVSLEGFGFGTDKGPEDWGLGAGFAVLTWYPGGGGFFTRVGLGAGGGDIMRRSTGELHHFEDAGAGLLGLGYEWQLTRSFALGVAADGIGFDLGKTELQRDSHASLGVFSIQFNWYL